MKSNYKEYNVVIYYIDKNNNDRKVVRKFWGANWDTYKLQEIAKTMEKKYNKDLYKIVGIAVQ